MSLFHTVKLSERALQVLVGAAGSPASLLAAVISGLQPADKGVKDIPHCTNKRGLKLASPTRIGVALEHHPNEPVRRDPETPK